MPPLTTPYAGLLSVVIPAFNETHRLPATLSEIRPFLERRFPRHEVVVVDDGSTDGLAARVEESARSWPTLRVLRQPRNLGKGAALRRGCLDARGDIVLFMDADHATPIDEMEAMVSILGERGYGVVVGCRTYQENESRWRRILGLSLQILAHLIVFERAVMDSQCGFKLFTRDVCQTLFSRCRVDGGMIDVELYCLMHKLGIPCFYQPVHWNNKSGSRINMLRCMLFDPLDLLRVRMRRAAGLYDRPLGEREQPWNR